MKRTSPTDAFHPLVNVQRFQSLTCEVNTRQLEELANYIEYVQSATNEKPTEGEVVGAALTELFKLDKGFQKWKEHPQKSDDRRTTDLAVVNRA